MERTTGRERQTDRDRQRQTDRQRQRQTETDRQTEREGGSKGGAVKIDTEAGERNDERISRIQWSNRMRSSNPCSNVKK